ncbi:hypothetical protein ACGFYY_32865 [Streptomyces sp. NPDC048331]|uniref:hypothetical protein n=1 Tax=Streptomyces sp. NPDC048331 TaxID=3365534 RepID=UPI00371683E9
MGTTLESFTALDTAVASGPSAGLSGPLDQVGRGSGSGSGCRALLAYIMIGLLAGGAGLRAEFRIHLLQVALKPMV